MLYCLGLQKQGLRCKKCRRVIHEKCLDLVPNDCTINTKSSSSSKHLKHGASLSKAFSWHSLHSNNADVTNEIANKTSSSPPQPSAEMTKKHHKTRRQYIESTYPLYFVKLKRLFEHEILDQPSSNHSSHFDDMDAVEKLFSSAASSSHKLSAIGDRHLRSKLSMFVRRGVALCGKDMDGFSDPYVTVQCAHSTLRRTRTVARTNDPLWNELIVFECAHTAEGVYVVGEQSDSHSMPTTVRIGSKCIVRVWDEDNNVKSRLDGLFLNEADDFLGQCVLDLHSLRLDEQEADEDCEDSQLLYKLMPRTQDDLVKGHIALSIRQDFCCKKIHKYTNNLYNLNIPHRRHADSYDSNSKSALARFMLTLRNYFDDRQLIHETRSAIDHCIQALNCCRTHFVSK